MDLLRTAVVDIITLPSGAKLASWHDSSRHQHRRALESTRAQVREGFIGPL